MEEKREQTQAFTKAASALADRKQKDCKVLITAREAIEYREYKRQKKRAEILAAISISEGILSNADDGKHISDRAVRLRQAAVRMSLERLAQTGESFLQSGVKIDCVIGGNGETLTKVKAYEGKKAVRLHAKEITLLLSPYAVESCRYSEIRKEVKKLRRVLSKITLKVSVDKAYPVATLAHIARICSESGAQYFCLPYFEHCERLRVDLSGGCKLQVTGVERLEDFKHLTSAGVGRIVTDRAWEIYNEWLREIEKINFPELMTQTEGAERGAEEAPQKKEERKNPILAALEKKAANPLLPSAVSQAEKAEEKEKTGLKIV